MKKLSIFLICGAVFAACLGRAQSNPQTTNEMKAEKINLPAPQETGATLFEALQKRASVREYADTGLTAEQLSGVLWAAAGENRPGRLTAPSAMALYPIRTYAVLPNAIYLYDAPSHSLTRVAEGDFRQLAGLQDFVYTAPLNIVYIADLERLSGLGDMPEVDMIRLASLDAAGYCQNANLWAAANGLGAVTRAGARGSEFLKAIGAPDTYRFILAQTIGGM